MRSTWLLPVLAVRAPSTRLPRLPGAIVAARVPADERTQGLRGGGRGPLGQRRGPGAEAQSCCGIKEGEGVRGARSALSARGWSVPGLEPPRGVGGGWASSLGRKRPLCPSLLPAAVLLGDLVFLGRLRWGLVRCPRLGVEADRGLRCRRGSWSRSERRALQPPQGEAALGSVRGSRPPSQCSP